MRPGLDGRDPWLAPPPRERIRRGAGVFVLLALAFAGALLLLPLALLLGAGTLFGVDGAGWLLALLLLLGLGGLLWTARRTLSLLRPAPVPLHAPASAPATGPEEELYGVLQQAQRQLPPQTRPAFQSAVLSAREALRATAGDTTLSREAFDARQVSRQDLPELLGAYQALPPGPEADRTFLEQLALIERRMEEVRLSRLPEQRRRLRANGEYLRSKYVPEENGED